MSIDSLMDSMGGGYFDNFVSQRSEIKQIKPKVEETKTCEEGPLMSVPRDVVFIILGHLPLRDLLAIGCTCKKLNDLVNDDRFWSTLDSQLTVWRKEHYVDPGWTKYHVWFEIRFDSQPKKNTMRMLKFFSECQGKTYPYGCDCPIPPFLFNEKVFALMRVKRWERAFKEFPEEFRSNKKFILEVLRGKFGYILYNNINKDLQQDEQIIKALANSKREHELWSADLDRKYGSDCWLVRQVRYGWVCFTNTPEALTCSLLGTAFLVGILLNRK